MVWQPNIYKSKAHGVFNTKEISCINEIFFLTLDNFYNFKIIHCSFINVLYI